MTENGLDVSAERLREILAGCIGVTAGPWEAGHHWVFVPPDDAANNPTKALRNILSAVPEAECQSNADHIARLDPQTVASVITELLARRIPPADNAVAVKALEWTEEWCGSNEDIPCWRGKSPFGWSTIIDFAATGIEAHVEAHADALAAKMAAAQADYETRIRSALEPTPSYAEGRAAGLREAAKAGWNACRKSIDAVCEDVQTEGEKHRSDIENPPRHHFGRGYMSAAKSIARGFNAMEAEDDDHFRAAIEALIGAAP